MKFLIKQTSGYYTDKKPSIEGLEEKKAKGKILYYKNIDSLNELLQIHELLDYELIIGRDSNNRYFLEIYDDYRE